MKNVKFITNYKSEINFFLRSMKFKLKYFLTAYINSTVFIVYFFFLIEEFLLRNE